MRPRSQLHGWVIKIALQSLVYRNYAEEFAQTWQHTKAQNPIDPAATNGKRGSQDGALLGKEIMEKCFRYNIGDQGFSRRAAQFLRLVVSNEILLWGAARIGMEVDGVCYVDREHWKWRRRPRHAFIPIYILYRPNA